MSKNPDQPVGTVVSVNESNSENWFKITAVILAVFILAGYAFFLYFLIGKASTEVDEKIWTRLIYLFAGVEAIVFSAAGFIFGRQVNRGRALKAEKDAKEAQKNEKEATASASKEKAKGENLAQLILSKVEKPATAEDQFKVRGISAGKEDNEIVDLAIFAKKVYPQIED